MQQQWRWATVPSIYYHIGDTWTSLASEQNRPYTLHTGFLSGQRHTEHQECQAQTQFAVICSRHWDSACESTDLCSLGPHQSTQSPIIWMSWCLSYTPLRLVTDSQHWVATTLRLLKDKSLRASQSCNDQTPWKIYHRTSFYCDNGTDTWNAFWGQHSVVEWLTCISQTLNLRKYIILTVSLAPYNCWCYSIWVTLTYTYCPHFDRLSRINTCSHHSVMTKWLFWLVGTETYPIWFRTLFIPITKGAILWKDQKYVHKTQVCTHINRSTEYGVPCYASSVSFHIYKSDVLIEDMLVYDLMENTAIHYLIETYTYIFRKDTIVHTYSSSIFESNILSNEDLST